MQVGKQIQHYRKEKNLSQDDLAEIIFVSRQSISNWERGATYPDIQNLLLLSKVFEVSLDQLIKGDVETMKHIIHDQEFMRYYPSCSILPWNWSYCSVVFLALTDFLPYQIKAKSSDLAFQMSLKL